MTSLIASDSPPSSSSGSSPSEERVERKFISKDLIFVGKGNQQPSKYTIIPQSWENDVRTIADEFLLKGLEGSTDEDTDNFFASKPSVLISVTGGAQDFFMQSSKLEAVFNRGLLKAAQNISAWIVDGGLDAGVMQYVGKAVKEMAVDDVPCIGIASHKMVILNELLTEEHNGPARAAEYVANQPNSAMKCALNPNHTHFILVDSPVVNWGQEIKFRSGLEEYIRSKFGIPVVLIVVNGGPGTLETVAQGSEKNFAIVVVEGSGRACDAIAALVKKAQKINSADVQTCDSIMNHKDDSVDLSPWSTLLAEAKGDQKKISTWTGFMDRILKNYKTITLFNAGNEGSDDMDIYILRAILSSPGRPMTLTEKLNLGVVWNRSDIITEVLESEVNNLSSEEKKRGLNEALEQSILLNRPEIFSILAEKGAQKESVNLKHLYFYKEIKQHFARIPAYAHGKSRIKNQSSSDLASLLPVGQKASEISTFSKDTAKNRSLIKEVFRAAGFHGYQNILINKFNAVDKEGSPLERSLTHSGHTIRGKRGKVYQEDNRDGASYTDFLIWAVFVNRVELAKAIWQKTTLPVHSALIACQLYRYLSHHSADKEEYVENSNWFEQEAIKMMDNLDYDDVKDVLNWEWAEMGNMTALDIAGNADCKKFVGHSHVQSLLDDMFYSDRYGKIAPTTPSYQIWASIIVPFFIWSYYKPAKDQFGADRFLRFIWFYHLPIVKFWTGTLFYCAFLAVQGYVLCNLDLLTDEGKFLPAEIVLWVWVFALIVEELTQFARDPSNHFAHLSNQMDFLLLVLHIVYMILRWISYANGNFHVFSGSVNTLIVACIFSWSRLLNVFAINHSLGPLFFIIVRLFKDIFLWIFVFVIFAVSFQIGFVNITLQAGGDPTSTYPTGSLPVSFFTIIGDFSYINDLMAQTDLGIALLAIYALIAQVMLVNLLIAMMGDTYSNVSDNSTEEWKFYRLELVMENRSASFHPPPTNLFFLPLELFRAFKLMCTTNSCCPDSEDEDLLPPKDGGAPLANSSSRTPLNKEVSNSSKSSFTNPLDSYDQFEVQKVLKKMRLARDEIVEKEQDEEETSVVSVVTGLKERLRTLSNERENDRAFLEKKFKYIEQSLRTQGGASGAAGHLNELREAVTALHQSHQTLAVQVPQILALLQQQQLQQQQLQQQLQLMQQARDVPNL